MPEINKAFKRDRQRLNSRSDIFDPNYLNDINSSVDSTAEIDSIDSGNLEKLLQLQRKTPGATQTSKKFNNGKKK